MRLRLILSFALVVLVALAAVLLITRQGAVREVGRYMTRSAMGLDAVAGALEQYYRDTGGWQGAEIILQEWAWGQQRGMGQGQGMMMGRPHLRLADSAGNVLADTRMEPFGQLTRAERGAAIPLRGGDRAIAGYLLAEAGQGMMMGSGANEQYLLNRLLNAALVAGAISGALALLLALALSYGLLKPVRDLTRAASRMAGGDLSQRVPATTRDEIGALGRAFNQMAESLERAELNRRAMTADIAHELRTPVAVQRAHLEALQDGIYPLTVENLQPILDQTELLTRLVEDLRTLALADAGALRMERVSTDLSALAGRTVDRFRPDADTRQVQLVYNDQTGGSLPPVQVDPGRIEQIINNLLTNALRHTPVDGSVAVTLCRKGENAVLSVADTGPGIPDEALPRIFERFYRADKARSRESGGAGLGLSIGRQLALAHGGDLTASNRAGSGAEFSLVLPIE